MTDTGEGAAREPLVAGFTRPARSAEAAIAFVLLLRRCGIRHPGVLRAMETVPRGAFVPRRYLDLADEDVAVPLPCGQTATAPGALGQMIAALEPDPRGDALEIGTGSGYGAAILGRCTRGVVSLERYETLALEAEGRMKTLGLRNVRIVRADALAPLQAERPFARILVNAACPALAPHWLACLAKGGRAVYARQSPAAGEPPRLCVAAKRADGGLDETLHGPLVLSALQPGLSAAL